LPRRLHSSASPRSGISEHIASSAWKWRPSWWKELISLMRPVIGLTAALSLILAVSAFAASPVNGIDRANAARACSSLHASLGAATFSKQYATFGSCTSHWVQTAHAARVGAQTACHAQKLEGRRLSACISNRTAATIATEVSTDKNAAKTCAAELKSLGTQAFEQKYGSNHNLRNAFGKCVSSHVPSTSPASGGGSSGTQRFTVSLAALNNSGVHGHGTLQLAGTALTVRLDVVHLESGQTHTIDIRGLGAGSATCPTAAADTNHDGRINLAEGQPFFGSELVALDASAHAGQSQTVSSSVLPFQTRTVVAFGATVNGVYDSSLPVACGTIALG
jgi:hypothetical protein